MHSPTITITIPRGVAVKHIPKPQLVFVNIININLVAASLTFPSDSLLTTVTHTVNQIELHSSSSAMREGVHVSAHPPPRGNSPGMTTVHPLDSVIRDLAMK
jgi:hypothetical protein